MHLAAFMGQQPTRLSQPALPALPVSMFVPPQWHGTGGTTETELSTYVSASYCELRWEQEWNLDRAGRSRVVIPPGRIWL